MILTLAGADKRYYLNEQFIVAVTPEVNKVTTLYTVELANGKIIVSEDPRFAAYLEEP